jgi:hypothetical protein
MLRELILRKLELRELVLRKLELRELELRELVLRKLELRKLELRKLGLRGVVGGDRTGEGAAPRPAPVTFRSVPRRQSRDPFAGRRAAVGLTLSLQSH